METIIQDAGNYVSGFLGATLPTLLFLGVIAVFAFGIGRATHGLVGLAVFVAGAAELSYLNRLAEQRVHDSSILAIGCPRDVGKTSGTYDCTLDLKVTVVDGLITRMDYAKK